MFFFQHPLADLVVPADDLAFIDRLWADWSPGFASSEDIESVKVALRDPANLQAALGYYRDTLSPEAMVALQGSPPVEPTQPLLYLHGAGDGCVGAEVAQMVDAANVRCEIVDGAGHFLHLEQPKIVNRLILEHLSTS
jgi:pimeloyl-ACP methyl ester carboxylesterase